MSRTGLTTRDRTRAPAPPADTPRAASAPAGRRRRARNPARRRLAALLLVPLLGGLAWLLWVGPVLAVRTVQVDGARALPADEVRAAAGIPEGTPLLRVDVAAARARVARLPQVASVQVTRGWPSSVVITLAERVPLAVVKADGRRALIDADGVLFDTVTGDPPAGVVPLDVPHPGPGDPATTAALAAVRALPADVRRQVVAAHASTGEDVSLSLAGGTTVTWGDGGDSAAKSTVLTALLQQLSAGKLDPAHTIDVSAPRAVVLR